MEKLLNKTDTQNFSKNVCLLSWWQEFLQMSEWIWWYFYQNFHIMIQAGMNWKTVNTSRIFSIEFRVTLPTYLLQGHWLIAVWTWAAETRVSWWCQIFHKIIICIKIFFNFKKTIIFLVNLEFPNLLQTAPGKTF